RKRPAYLGSPCAPPLRRSSSCSCANGSKYTLGDTTRPVCDALHLCRTTARVYLDDLRARGDVYAVVGEAPQRAADRCAKDSAACLGDHVSAGNEVADAQRRAEDAARGRVDVAVTAMPVYLPWLTRKVEGTPRWNDAAQALPA